MFEEVLRNLINKLRMFMQMQIFINTVKEINICFIV